MTTILLVEDDKNQRLLYEQELRLEEYARTLQNVLNMSTSKKFDALKETAKETNFNA